MHEHPTTSGNTPSTLLRQLRALLPEHELSLAELFALLDDLAHHLRTACGITGDILPTEIISSLPHFRIENTDFPISGFSFWDDDAKEWVIRLNEDEAEPVRRFTLLHEFGHILWHGWEAKLFPGMEAPNMDRLSEFAADLFAGEALTPKHLMARAYSRGLHSPTALARRFEVSTNTVRWKLDQMNLPTPARADIIDVQQSIRPRIAPLVEITS
ncbi:MAG: hypothetical protein QOH56_404 [Pseudonocardiales bacterium]|nr:hypothetical protein [Pseudonocardiales bacterium]